MEALGQRQIVGGPERAAAKVAELEPSDAAGGARHGQVARSDLDVPRADRAAVSQGVRKRAPAHASASGPSGK